MEPFASGQAALTVSLLARWTGHLHTRRTGHWPRSERFRGRCKTHELPLAPNRSGRGVYPVTRGNPDASPMLWHDCATLNPGPNSKPNWHLRILPARTERTHGHRISKQAPVPPKRQHQIPRILDLGCRLLHPRGQGRAEIQGLHPPPHLHQAPLRRLRRRAEPHRRRGRLAQEGLPARQGRPQARPLLPAAGAGGSRAARLVRHPQALRQDRRRRHHPHAGHRPGKPAPAGHHRPRRLQCHHGPS